MPSTFFGLKKVLFKRPWLHFLKVAHSSTRLFLRLRRGSGSRCGAFAVGFAVDDELMSTVAETIQCTLPEERFIENRHPFLDGPVGRDDGRRSSVALYNQVVEVG